MGKDPVARLAVRCSYRGAKVTTSSSSDLVEALRPSTRALPQNRLPCPVEGCIKPRRTRGLCANHYLRALRAEKRRAAAGKPS
ncbi:hypothetical protein GCM10025792_03990 [Pseudonocardia tropica]